MLRHHGKLPDRSIGLWTPARGLGLQRKCSCGSSLAVASDRRLERHSPGAGASGFDFSKIAIQAPARAIQAKLTISQPGDPAEKEAESIARQVIQRQENRASQENPGDPLALAPLSVHRLIQRSETSFPDDSEEKIREEGQVQRKGAGSIPAQTADLGQRLDSLAGSGQPLPDAPRRQMQAGFGVRFDQIRIHTDGEAARISRSLNAEAFTYGNDIYFGTGKFDHSSKTGKELLAHELTHTLQQGGLRRRAVQRRGGPTVGQLSINTNVVSAGLTAGHAWLAYTPTGGSMTTYGTWGNRAPIGLHRDLELGYRPTATRTTDLDSGDQSALTSFAAANNTWSYTNNCASFAARGWRSVSGESLDYTTLGIPNPSALGAGIVAANGGTTGILPTTPAAAPKRSSSSF